MPNIMGFSYGGRVPVRLTPPANFKILLVLVNNNSYFSAPHVVFAEETLLRELEFIRLSFDFFFELLR